MTNSEKKLTEILSEQIEKEINNEILKQVNHIARNRAINNEILKQVNHIARNRAFCSIEDAPGDLERRPYKQKKKTVIHKTPEVKKGYIYAKWIPTDNPQLVGNVGEMCNKKVKSRYYLQEDSHINDFYTKINDNNMIGL